MARALPRTREQMQADFVRNEGQKVKRERTKSGALKRGGSLPRGKRIAPVSEDQTTLKKRWAFIKACMILAQRRTSGFTSCMECGAVEPRKLELDHIIPTGNGGTWTPDNAQLLCAGPGSCHARKHGEPEWTQKESA